MRTLAVLNFVLVGACARSVQPDDAAHIDASVPSDDAALDGCLADVTTDWTECRNTFFDYDATCACIGWNQIDTPGICVPDGLSPLGCGDELDTCFDPAMACLCVAESATQPGLCGDCAPLDFCTTLVATGLDTASGDDWFCRYGDGAHVTTGVLPAAACPAGTDGVVCGDGCAPCAAGAVCWGRSEAQPLGLCMPQTADDPPLCARRTDCGAGRGCLWPVARSDVLSTLSGFCVAAPICDAVAQYFAARFICVP